MKIRSAYRIVTFLPVGPGYIGAADFLKQINDVLPLTYGNYDMVAYHSPGTEQFRPLPGATPTSGTQNDVSTLPSIRVEFSIPHDEGSLNQCLSLIQSLHAWEEPVIQIYSTQETIAGATPDH